MCLICMDNVKLINVCNVILLKLNVFSTQLFDSKQPKLFENFVILIAHRRRAFLCLARFMGEQYSANTSRLDSQRGIWATVWKMTFVYNLVK
ncbi:hypothetical protein VNO77_01052 [Canavalia gladiata]|uniref:Uncharacterized protein n=1 Tax=Canavalia gladiata TaxID=3824 RepID=A0AAN9R4Y7_CANGL